MMMRLARIFSVLSHPSFQISITRNHSTRNVFTMSSNKDFNLNEDIWDSDPELFNIIRKEKVRQQNSLELIASENFTMLSVLQCLCSCLHNDYSEGLALNRYFKGNEYIDEMETLCMKRCLEAFNLNPNEWGVNVQPYSGSPANLAVFIGVVEPHGRIMGLDLPDGGHLSHGFMTGDKRISAPSKFFETMPYKINPTTGLIDYDKLAETAKLFKPRLIIAGISCYSRILDYKRFKEIADENGAYLMSDMAHVSGLVAAGLIPSPFEYSDIVTTTTHKALRGPRAGIIFFRKGVRSTKANGDNVMYDLEDNINNAVFPGLQGSSHKNSIAGIAAVMKFVKTPEFAEYQKQVLVNSKRLAEGLKARGYDIVTGGTDVHLVLIDLRSKNIPGDRAEEILKDISITCNINAVPGEKDATNPSGIRLGTPALTTRGLKEDHIDIVVDFIDQGLKLSHEVVKISGPEFTDFKRSLIENSEIINKVNALKSKVEEFSRQFPLPGFSDF